MMMADGNYIVMPRFWQMRARRSSSTTPVCPGIDWPGVHVSNARAYVGTLFPITPCEAAAVVVRMLDKHWHKPLAAALWAAQRDAYGRDSSAALCGDRGYRNGYASKSWTIRSGLEDSSSEVSRIGSATGWPQTRRQHADRHDRRHHQGLPRELSHFWTDFALSATMARGNRHRMTAAKEEQQ